MTLLHPIQRQESHGCLTAESGHFLISCYQVTLIFRIKELFTVVYLVAQSLYCSEAVTAWSLNDCQKYNHMIIPCTCSFPNNFNMLLVITRNSDWFITLFTPVVIGLSNSLGTVCATVI